MATKKKTKTKRTNNADVAQDFINFVFASENFNNLAEG